MYTIKLNASQRVKRATLENGQKKLKELFDGRKIFNIPAYQRAYAWETARQLPDFLEDIENQSMERDYFLGTILFREQTEKEAGFDIIDIVDGQQRITTIIIFMKVILDALKARMSSDEFEQHGLDLVEETYLTYKTRPKLRAISTDNDFFQAYVLGDGNGNDNITTPSQRRLYQAKQYFFDNLTGKTTDELLVLKKKLDECSKVLTYSVKDAAEATLIFETTNDRGKSLTNLEKIKSFLMYKIYLAAGEETLHQLSTIQQRFSEIFREVESFDGHLKEDDVLRHHFIAFENWTDRNHFQQPVDFIRLKLNEMINKGETQKVVTFVDQFSLRLKESFRTMRDLRASKSRSFRDLACLRRLDGFYPLLMKAYKADDTVEKSHFETTCKFLEIFSFRVLAIRGSRSDAGQTLIYTSARDFTGRYTKLFDNLRTEIDRFSTRKNFHESLCNTEIYHENASDLPYLMWKYENHLRNNEQPICPEMSEEEFLDNGKKKRLTIEHIASQTPNTIVEDRGILSQLDRELLAENIHRLGNLTFDPASANSSKSNSTIEIKNSKYFTKAPYKTQNELEKFLSDGKWDLRSIEEREKKIIDFCMKYWNPEYVIY